MRWGHHQYLTKLRKLSVIERKTGRRKTKKYKTAQDNQQQESVEKEKKEREEKKYFQFITIWYLTYIIYIFCILLGHRQAWSQHCGLGLEGYSLRVVGYFYFSGGQRSSAQVFIYLPFLIQQLRLLNKKSWREADKSHKSNFLSLSHQTALTLSLAYDFFFKTFNHWADTGISHSKLSWMRKMRCSSFLFLWCCFFGPLLNPTHQCAGDEAKQK